MSCSIKSQLPKRKRISSVKISPYSAQDKKRLYAVRILGGWLMCIYISSIHSLAPPSMITTIARLSPPETSMLGLQSNCNRQGCGLYSLCRVQLASLRKRCWCPGSGPIACCFPCYSHGFLSAYVIAQSYRCV